MEILAPDPLVKIIGIAEVNPNAVGLELARRLKIPVTRDFRKLLAMKRVELIIDVTGDPTVEATLQDFIAWASRSSAGPAPSSCGS